MTGELTLRVITPDHIVLDTTASSIQAPGVDGLLGILPRHAPMVASLDIGLLTFRSGGKQEAIFVSGGFLEVRDNTVRVVSEAGERPEEIDQERAESAEKRARERLEQGRSLHSAEIDLLRAELSLKRASKRQQAKSYSSSLV